MQAGPASEGGTPCIASVFFFLILTAMSTETLYPAGLRKKACRQSTGHGLCPSRKQAPQAPPRRVSLKRSLIRSSDMPALAESVPARNVRLAAGVLTVSEVFGPTSPSRIMESQNALIAARIPAANLQFRQPPRGTSLPLTFWTPAGAFRHRTGVQQLCAQTNPIKSRRWRHSRQFELCSIVLLYPWRCCRWLSLLTPPRNPVVPDSGPKIGPAKPDFFNSRHRQSKERRGRPWTSTSASNASRPAKSPSDPASRGDKNLARHSFRHGHGPDSAR